MHTFSTHRPDDRQPCTPVSPDRELYSPHPHIHPGRRPTGGHSQADAVTHIIPGLQPNPSRQARPPTGGHRPIIRATILPAASDGLRAPQTATGQPHHPKLPVPRRSLHNLQHERQLRHSPHEVFMADSFPGDVTRYRTLVQVDKEDQKFQSLPNIGQCHRQPPSHRSSNLLTYQTRHGHPYQQQLPITTKHK